MSADDVREMHAAIRKLLIEQYFGTSALGLVVQESSNALTIDRVERTLTYWTQLLDQAGYEIVKKASQ